MKHHQYCTWEQHLAAGETAPGQSFYGQLNYLWCQSFCDHEPSEIDYKNIYEGAYGKRYSYAWRLVYYMRRFSWASRLLRQWATRGTVMQRYEGARYQRMRVRNKR